MIVYTGLFLLVIAVSLDGLGVGISYGIQKTRLPLFPILIIMLCSGATVFFAMTIGNVLKNFISPTISENLGAVILIFLGLFTLSKLLVRRKNESEKDEHSTVFSDMKRVLQSPQQADLDQSGTISKQEAILLGIALALDAFGAGIAASLLQYHALLTAVLVALMSGIFLKAGLRLGFLLSKYEDIQFFSYVPSLLLISIGLINLIS